MKRNSIWLLSAIAGISLAIIAPIYFVYAGYVEEGESFEVKSRLEVSSDNATWVNYSAEENSGNETLTVAPGGNIYWRIKTWNSGEATAGATTFNGTFVNGRFIQDLSLFSCDDSIGDCNLDAADPSGIYTVTEELNANTFSFAIPSISQGTTVDEGFESGGFSATIAADTPDQSEVTLTVTIAGSEQFISLLDRIVSRAHADELATTTVRILVQAPAAAATATATTLTTLPATGSDVIN